MYLKKQVIWNEFTLLILQKPFIALQYLSSIHYKLTIQPVTIYKYWLLRVLWLKLWLSRWSTEPSIFPRRSRGKIERNRDHRGSYSFNHCTSKSSQYLFYNTPNISKNCTIKLQTWMLQSTDDANTDSKNFYCAACSVVQSEMVTNY